MVALSNSNRVVVIVIILVGIVISHGDKLYNDYGPLRGVTPGNIVDMARAREPPDPLLLM